MASSKSSVKGTDHQQHQQQNEKDLNKSDSNNGDVVASGPEDLNEHEEASQHSAEDGDDEGDVIITKVGRTQVDSNDHDDHDEDQDLDQDKDEGDLHEDTDIKHSDKVTDTEPTTTSTINSTIQ